MIKLLVTCVLFCTLVFCIDFKQLQGPPEEFDEYVLPQPQLGSQASDSAVIPIYLRHIPGPNWHDYVWSGEIPVDSSELLIISLLSKIKNLKMTVLKSNSSKWIPAEVSSEVEEGSFGLGDSTKAQIPYVSYSFQEPERGIWKIEIHSSQENELPEDKLHASMIIENRSVFKIWSHMTSYKHVKGQEIGVVSRLFTDSVTSNHAIKSEPLPIRSESLIADLDITLPDGTTTSVEMRDDGKHSDKDARDGVYGATVKAELPGTYTATVVMRGETPSGHKFLRTTQHLFSVTDVELKIKKSCTIDADRRMIRFTIRGTSDDDLANKQLKAYAEVWGRKNGKPAPVAWMSGMTIAKKLRRSKKDYEFSLSLSAKWLKKAGVRKLTQLKNLYIQDVNTYIPFAEASEVKIEGYDETKLEQLLASVTYTTIDEEMLMGPRPPRYTMKSLRKAANKTLERGKIVLVHGYCSGGNPFTESDFTDTIVYHDPNANKPTDVFAQELKEFIEPYISEGVSFVAHSQGGLASTHLTTFYWSPADVLQSNSGRLVQSVGSPYLGSALAGTAAKLGRELGFGCGENPSLTRDGAKLWQTTIPKANQERVYYYTTQYKPWSYCVLPLQALLAWPNDGTAEKEYSELKHGHYVNHKEKFCHSSGMKYPSQCKDSERNREMNNLAARF